MPTTELRSRLLACRDAEDYFALLDVPFDPHLLQVNRLHVLRLFGRDLHAFLRTGPGNEIGNANGNADADDDGAAAADRLRAALAAAHDAFTDATALDHRLFKVLRDRAPRGFVPLAAVQVEDRIGEVAP